jgi:serine protease AprX
MPRRYKVRFNGAESYNAAQAFETVNTTIRVRNEKRYFISIDLPPALQGITAMENTLDTQLSSFEKYYGAEVVEDYQYDMDESSEIFDVAHFSSEDPNDPSLDDVLTMIEAREAWQSSTGRNITIAVVDTGIDGSRPEFPTSKRVGSWQPEGDTPWTDWKGHGTMCACIAAGTSTAGGVFQGVAPDAGIIACKTHFYETELTAIYDYLTDLANQGMIIVATNSFGMVTGTPPSPPPDNDFISALEDAMAAGIKVFFSAGNNHKYAGGQPNECSPTSIWLHKCRSDVMSVATCKLDKTMWYYSSRGPGQHYGQANTNRKPDVTAPTPENGRIVYGGDIRTLPNGWGTSGACPQAAGLAALLLAKNPSLSTTSLFDTIRNTTTPLGHSMECEGTGLLNCKKAIDAI